MEEYMAEMMGVPALNAAQSVQQGSAPEPMERMPQ
jgi:hypothetical protein